VAGAGTVTVDALFELPANGRVYELRACDQQLFVKRNSHDPALRL
jgi:hypothetical protein